MAGGEGQNDDREPRQACDVMAFGRQTGRVLSDGTIVGRAEPFTKVFPSSRAVKRQVGLVAWAILEDIALDARLDDAGRLVADTNVRRIADNLDLSKNTVSKHLGRLREAGFTLREEARQESGRWGGARYVLDPSACLERFTTTPTRHGREADQADSAADSSDSADRPNDAESDGSSPCTNSWDTATGAVSQSTGHRDLGHTQEHACGEDQQQQHQHTQHRERDDEHDGGLLDGLLAVEVDPDVANRLLDNHPAEAIADALTVVDDRQADNPAGWVVAAVRQGWDLSDEVAQLRCEERRRSRVDEQVQARTASRQRAQQALDRDQGWHQVISAELSDAQLAVAVAQIADGLPAIASGSVPVIVAELTRRWVAVHDSDPPRAEPVRGLMEADPSEEVGGLPDPPVPSGEVPPLQERIAELLDHLDSAEFTVDSYDFKEAS